MKIDCIILFMVFAVTIFGYSKGSGQRDSFPSGKWVDLSHDYSEETPYWPTADGFKLTVDFNGMTEGGYYYAANSFCGAEHGGTHIDAPIHFARDRLTVDRIPLEQLVGEGVVLDVSENALENPDYLVSVSDLKKWEHIHGSIPEGAILLIKTGYHRYWPDRIRYMGTDERGPGAVAKLHFPGLDPEAARWLVDSRNLKAIGLDTPSIDYGQSKMFKSHRILFEKNIPAFENLANLDELPVMGFHIIALPMKIKGGSGAPLRVVAFIPDS